MKKNKIKYIIKEIYILLIIIIIIILSKTLIEIYQVPTNSMSPNIIEKDLILANKYIYKINLLKINIKKPNIGDIIIYNYNKINYVKRIICKNYDYIYYYKKYIYINNKIIKRKIKNNIILLNSNCIIINLKKEKEYLKPKKEYYIYIYNNMIIKKYNKTKLKLQKKKYFIIGDNRDNSEDSRKWGELKNKYIIGKPIFIIFNTKKIRRNLKCII